MKRQAIERLARIRRFEGAGFRAWPASQALYDGTWSIRMTASHPARRLNSVNPLDPGDDRHLVKRVEQAARRFEAYGRLLTFRISPLSAPAISAYLDELDWTKGGECLVMRLPLDNEIVGEAMDQIPLRDLNRFVSSAFVVHGYEQALRPGFTEVVTAIKPEAGLFVLEQAAAPVATAICVHDDRLAGLFEMATMADRRGEGFGRRMLLSALKWVHLRGAAEGWLQVNADNRPAMALYRSLGFQEIYRFHYRQPPAEK